MTRMLTIADVAERVQMSRGTIREAVAAGDLAGFKFGNTYRIDPQDVEAWIASHRVTCADSGSAVTLLDARPAKTPLRQMARQMERGQGSPVTDVHGQKAG